MGWNVQATLLVSRRATYADYLVVERGSEHRHELIDGVIVAMAGGSDEHNAIAGRLAMLLGLRVRPPCRYYTAGQRFWIASRGRARYSDGSVVRGKPEHPPHDDRATTNPSLVVEVLSPSTEGDDRGDKRMDFQTLRALAAYVVASQDARRVEVWRRAAEGAWPAAPEVYVDGDRIELPGLSEALTVAEVYEGVLDQDGRSPLR